MRLAIAGTSVNPACSLGPCHNRAGSNPLALKQVWLFIIAPLIGAGLAGFSSPAWEPSNIAGLPCGLRPSFREPLIYRRESPSQHR
jgi:hypothetical protein